MHVLLNTESIRHPLTGIGHYTWHVLAGLRQHPAVECVRCVDLNGVYAGPTALPEGSVTQNIDAKLRERIGALPFAYEVRQWWRNRVMSRFSLSTDAIYHEPNFILRPYVGRSIAVVHDLSHVHYPNYHPLGRVRFLNKHLPITLERATHIITGSDFVAQELITLMGIKSEKITRIYHGVSVQFHPRTSDALTPVLLRYGLSDVRYLLTVGTLEPRKNILQLLQAYARLPLLLQQQHPLVVVGARGWKMGPLEHVLSPLVNRGVVILLGYVSEADLPFIYAGAHAFTYLSCYEGFGLPPIEAMASGVPVLIANRSSLPEVANGAAAIVDPDDSDAITVSLEQILTDTTLRQRLSQAGPNRGQSFTWGQCVNETVALYQRL